MIAVVADSTWRRVSLLMKECSSERKSLKVPSTQQQIIINFEN
jgi:hypothetical protein